MSVFERGTQYGDGERPARSEGPSYGTATMNQATSIFYHQSTGKRTNTDSMIVQGIRKEYADQNITTVPVFDANLLQFAAAGHASANIFKDDKAKTLKWRPYIPPLNRLNSATGGLADQIFFAKYVYTWKEHEFIMFYLDGSDDSPYHPAVNNQYLVGDTSEVDELILAAGQYTNTLHDQIWVFDQGYWQKDSQLWQSIQKAQWKSVILDEDIKKHLSSDVQRFFNSQKEYEKLAVPWKRGVIFHGPPGNGKTISIKATMHMLYERKDPIPTLYVKTLAAFFPPEFSLGIIFAKARQQAPCYLVFEDLDSVVSDGVRSFFLNEVDGISNNDGILMVGSTNHLDLLDPGISKRPSRFDRKYYFPNPSLDQRVQYCKFWQGKLSDNKDVKFPDSLCLAIARITNDFSFAYIQEAFVAALLVIASSREEKDGAEVEKSFNNLQVSPTPVIRDTKVTAARKRLSHERRLPVKKPGESEHKNVDDWEVVESNDQKLAQIVSFRNGIHESDKPGGEPEDPLDDYLLWMEIKKQIALLRHELESEAN